MATWGWRYEGDEEITNKNNSNTPEINFPVEVVSYYHTRKFMAQAGYDGLVPRMDTWCIKYRIKNHVYVKVDDLMNLTWKTFIDDLRENVECKMKVLK